MRNGGKATDSVPLEKSDLEAFKYDEENLKMPENQVLIENQAEKPNDSLNYLMKPFAHINETKDVLHRLGTVTIIRKQMVFSDREFEQLFIESLEDKLGSRMMLFGIACCLHAVKSMFFLNFFTRTGTDKPSPTIYHWGQPANKLFNIGCLINLAISFGIIIISWKRNFFRHKLERVFQYFMIVLMLVVIMLMSVWRVSCLVAGDRLPSDVLREAFKGVTDPYPDSDVIMLLTACVFYLAVVAGMRFRRLVWVCIVSFMVYSIAVIYYKLPRFESVKFKDPSKPVDPFSLQPDASGTAVGTQVTESPDTMLNWSLALQLGAMFLISLFGKTQLELLQRQNFLELELAQKRIDVLEKTINAIDSKNEPHSHVEKTHRRLKDAERIIEKLKLMNSGEAMMTGSSSTFRELETVLNVLKETEKTMTIMDFQKEVLISPIKTGLEYKEEEVIYWLERLVGSRQENNAPGSSITPPALIPITSIQTVSGDRDLGISAKSLMKRLGVEWHFDPVELERTLKSNHASDMNAFCLTARALLSPFLNNVLLGVSPDVLSGFAKAMSDAYLDVPFHRGDHAAMVCHHASVLMELTGVRKQLGGLDRFAVLIAALGHDVNHFGRSNNFLMDTKHELSLRYNDQSVLENFHASKTFELIRSSNQTNILVTLSKRDEKRFRSRVIQLILATDSSQHFQHLSELRMRLMGSTQIFQDPEVMESDRRIGMTSVLNAADIGFFSMPLDVHMSWMERLAEEMAQQGDNERALNMSISPMCDRSSQDLPGMALGMMKLLVMPLFVEISNLSKKANPSDEAEREMDAIMDSLTVNQKHWEAKRRGATAHLDSMGSFDMFIPVPKVRTITASSNRTHGFSSDIEPSSPPSLIPIESPFSSSFPPRMTLEPTAESTIKGGGDDNELSEDSHDEGPPILPFNAVHKV
jgi:hypothetical protein